MKRILLSGAAALVAVSVASFASAASLTIGQGAAITGTDPHWHRHSGNASVAGHVFESLNTRDHAGNLVPQLATEWKPIGDNQWEFKLREGVTFHDGTPFTAKDAICSFERVKKGIPNSPGPYTSVTIGMEKLEAKDDHTLLITTPGPYPAMYLDVSLISIISCKHGENATTEDYTRGTAMVGTGPYKFQEWVPGQHIKFTRNESYWGGAEPWEEVTIKFMNNGPARLAAMLSGDVDMIDQVPTTDIEQLRGDKRIKLWSSQSGRLNYIAPGFYDSVPAPAFTTKDGKPLDKNPFLDLRVRKALSLAIDRNVIKDRVNQGEAVIAKQVLLEGAYGYIPGYDMSRYDPAEAKKLLAEAGYPDGFKVTLATSNDRIINAVKTVQAIGQMWSRIGITTEIETMPHAVFSKRRNALELPLFMSSWGNTLMDPLGYLPPQFMTYDKEKGHGTANRSRYSNAEVDRITIESMGAVDPAKREKLSQDALKIAMDDYAHIPLSYWVATYATKPGIMYEARVDEYTRAMNTKPVMN